MCSIHTEAHIQFIHLSNCSTLQVTADDLQRSFRSLSSLHESLLRCDIFADEQLKGIWIVSDYCQPGNTLLLSKRLGGFTESLIAHFVKEILSVLVALEEKPCCQGLQCIKGSNILFDSDGHVKIVDYHQLPVILPLLGEEFNMQPSQVYWNGPENKDREMAPNFSGDIWALGVWMIELAQGNTPLLSHGPCKVASCLDSGERPQLEYPFRYSFDLLDFLYQCLQGNPQLRPKPSELLAHPFLSAAKKEDVDRILLHNYPQDRCDQMEDIYLAKEWITILSGNKFAPLAYISVFDVPIEKTKLQMMESLETSNWTCKTHFSL